MNWITAIAGLAFFYATLMAACASGVALNQTTFGYDGRRRAVEAGDLRVWGLTAVLSIVSVVLLLWR